MPDSDRLAALRRDFERAAGLDLRTWLDLVHATIELAVARVRLRSRQARDLLGSSETASRPSPQILDRSLVELVERVAFAIPRAGRRLPWRADCLVQALAAQRWLGRHGVDTQIIVGVPKPMPSDFEAHAWLKAGGRVVTGGDISGYVPLTGDQA